MRKISIVTAPVSRSIILIMLAGILLTGCAVIGTEDPTEACPVTEAEWAKPSEDSAIPDPPAYGYYHINDDRSIWASAWWTDNEEYPLRATEEGAKVGWFRPAGIDLEITGQRMDGQTPPLEAHIPCCYPTRFQATGLYFPAEGCWEVTARAGDSVLSFVVSVEP